MTKRSASLMSTFVLLVGIAVCAGSAFAGNGNGQGSPPASPGNSANAPGQVKKSTASTQSAGGGSVDQNSVSRTGVKPTSGTFHDTHCTTTSTGCTSTGVNATTMGAGDASKRYGDDTTAAQIATASGAPAGTPLHGPGNSQPHKAALCPGGGHEVDVHALKAKGQQKSCVTSGPTPTTSVPTSHAVTVSVTGGAAVVTPTAAAAGAAPAVQVTTPQGKALGVTTSQGKPAGGVLGAIAAVGQGELPFTGFPLWAAVLGAVALFASGLVLRHVGRATA